MPTENAKNNFLSIAKGIAIAAAALSIIVIILIVINYLHTQLLDPLQAERLGQLKLKFFDQSQNEDLKSQIRQLDLSLRKDIIHHHYFISQGVTLLTIFVLLFFISFKTSIALNPKKILLPKLSDTNQNRHTLLTVFTSLACLLIFAAIAFFWLLSKPIDTQTASAAKTYPSSQELEKNWPSFRGPHGNGTSAYTSIPQSWDGQTGKNILWKSPIPLPGHNSPIVWNDKIFISGADQKKRHVYCFDAVTGKLLWQGDIETPANPAKDALKLDQATSYAAPTLATDGRYVCAIFPNGDIASFTCDGQKQWQKNFGVPDNTYGYASSLVIYHDTVIIQNDQASAADNKSYLLALYSATGSTVWQVKRPVGSSWSSPIIIEDANHRDQLITCANPFVIAYDPANGKELWRCEGLAEDLAPSPIYTGKFVIATQPNSKVFAINPLGSGDITKSKIIWQSSESIPDITSPTTNGSLVFTLTSQGTLTCYQSADGKKLWQQEYSDSFLASPSIVGQYIYLLSEKGSMYIAKFDREFTKVGKSDLAEKCYASPAFSNGCIFIRAEKNLYCIGSTNQ